MDDELLRRLQTEQARALLDDADPHHAVMLACDLLTAGVGGDAVVALAAESARTLPVYDANRRLAAVTDELGLPEPDLPTWPRTSKTTSVDGPTTTCEPGSPRWPGPS
ncbi:hypothetical protein AB0J14_16580 [Micromonospora arborensis]|uniref:hypothetical protein n=1 Tax=Micromonospora arborensis TaxID=2116518 RepID=UPI0033D188FD